MERQRQLLHLREIEDANRQIAACNAAAEVVNRRETKKAVEILDLAQSSATRSH